MPSSPTSNLFLNELDTIAESDVAALTKAQASYGNSWKLRGGIGAFMMLARKWDRIENAAKAAGYDVFALIENDKRAEGVIDDIRDLRRYLMLAEAEARAMGFCPGALAKDQEDGTASKGGKGAWGLQLLSDKDRALFALWLHQIARRGDTSLVTEAMRRAGVKINGPYTMSMSEVSIPLGAAWQIVQHIQRELGCPIPPDVDAIIRTEDDTPPDVDAITCTEDDTPPASALHPA